MRPTKWAGAGALALLLLAAPRFGYARSAPDKQIVVDWKTALVYPLQDWDLAHKPIQSNNREEFADKDIGSFPISEKVVDKRSNLYNVHGKPLQPGEDAALMRYWMRLGYSAQGFHQSPLFERWGPPHRSHGCYRLSRRNAIWLFDWAPVGTEVYVVPDIHHSRFAYLLDQAAPKRVVAKKPRPAVRITPARTETAQASVTITPAPAGSPDRE